MSKPPTVHNESLATLTPDGRNANKGTASGRGLLAKSIAELGAGRSVVVDAKGQIVAGNKSVEAFVEAGMTDAIVVDSDGTRPIVVRRVDWDLDDRKGAARRYAYLDNRVAEVDLEWDLELVNEDAVAGGAAEGLFDQATAMTDDELASYFDDDHQPGEKDERMVLKFKKDDHESVTSALKAKGLTAEMALMLHLGVRA